MKLDSDGFPAWLTPGAGTVVVLGVAAILSQNLYVWLAFAFDAMAFGVILIHYDRKDRARRGRE